MIDACQTCSVAQKRIQLPVGAQRSLKVSEAQGERLHCLMTRSAVFVMSQTETSLQNACDYSQCDPSVTHQLKWRESMCFSDMVAGVAVQGLPLFMDVFMDDSASLASIFGNLVGSAAFIVEGGSDDSTLAPDATTAKPLNWHVQLEERARAAGVRFSGKPGAPGFSAVATKSLKAGRGGAGC